MTEDNSTTTTTAPQPSRPFILGAQKYDVLRELTKPKPSPTPELQRERIFTATFIATKEKGGSMNNEEQFLIELIFKPNEGKLRLRPEETQLLLAYYAELLKEITDEEQVIIEGERSP